MDLEGASETPAAPVAPPQRVVVTDLDMQFGTMIWFMVKFAVAAIPAAAILAVIVAVVVAMFR